MDNLFGFGCSYTEGWDLDINSNYIKYKEWRGGNLPKIWLELLSEKLNLNLINYAKAASGNDLIFHTFIEHINEIKKGDTVIVGWSFMGRYRWVGNDNWYNEIWSCNGPGDMSEKNIKKEVHEEICINRTHPLYVKDVENYMELMSKLSKLVGFNLYFWSCEDNIIYNKPLNEKLDKKYIMGQYEHHPLAIVLNKGGQRIIEETNNEIIDYHMGELGHQVQCDLFYNHISLIKII